MSEIRPSNRRNFLRLRVYGVACEFMPNAPLLAAAPPPAVAQQERLAPAQVPAPAPADKPMRGERSRIAGGRYNELIAQVYRADRVVHLERKPFAPLRTGGQEQPPASTPAKVALTGELLDVGGGGARFALREGDWSVRSRPSGRLAFEISGQRFDFACELVRKTENRSTFEYVATWRRPRPVEIDRLMRAIFQIELSRRQPQAPAATGRKPRRRWIAFDRGNAAWAAVGLAAGGAAFVLSGAHALPVWGGMGTLLLIAALLAH